MSQEQDDEGDDDDDDEGDFDPKVSMNSFTLLIIDHAPAREYIVSSTFKHFYWGSDGSVRSGSEQLLARPH